MPSVTDRHASHRPKRPNVREFSSLSQSAATCLPENYIHAQDAKTKGLQSHSVTTQLLTNHLFILRGPP